ncbi:MAG: orotidine-5'-phosphate decarboxylase [Phycisphaerales bacterium]|nr:MAG: orotidine-5'-phosphate decarboxylase [Phycisphaerales bacterium]
MALNPWPGLLMEAIDRTGSAACVGLDPVASRMPDAIRQRHRTDPVDAIGAFGIEIVRAVAGVVPVVKLQSACYERFGSAGVRVMERTAAAAREAGLLVLLDAKRGDIGISAQHYAAAGVALGADAITVSPYLGTETLEPYVDAGLGMYALVRTSNPGSGELQSLAMEDGQTVAERVARTLASFGGGHTPTPGGLSAVGAVVGATKASELAGFRELMPDQPVLVPGVGAQGGTVADCRALRRASATGLADAGVLITASRSVIYAEAATGESWLEAVRRAAGELSAETASVLG